MAAMKPHGLHTPASKRTPVRDELLSWFAGAMFISGVMFWAESFGLRGFGLVALFCIACPVWVFPCVESLKRYYRSE